MIFLSANNQGLAAAYAEIDAKIRDLIEGVWASDFVVDDLALSLRGHAYDAAKHGQWELALSILLAAAIREPAVFLTAYQSWGWALAVAFGAVDGAANGPSPVVTDGHRSSVLVPPPWTVAPDRWASPFGQATVTPAGALRIELSTELGRNCAVTLPLVSGRCRRVTMENPPTNACTKFGVDHNALERVRKSKGWTQEQAAHAAGANERSSYNRWELGKGQPSIEQAHRFAAAAGVPFTDLLHKGAA